MILILVTAFIIIGIVHSFPKSIVIRRHEDKGFEVRDNGRSVYVHITDEKKHAAYREKLIRSVIKPEGNHGRPDNG